MFCALPRAVPEAMSPGRAPPAVLGWLLPLLICPVCGHGLAYRADPDDEDGLLYHADAACAESYPVIEGIPRLLVGSARARLVRQKAPWFLATAPRSALLTSWRSAGPPVPTASVVAGFDYEWTRFQAVGTKELDVVFRSYSDILPADSFAEGLLVVDAGCGAGRWAFEVARRGPRVIAVDLGQSVELARRNTAATGRVACVQADVQRLPLARGAFDWAYTLGVLHHLDRPAEALSEITRTVRSGGHVLVYVYYALEGRGPAYRLIFRAVDLLRRVLSRSPRALAFAIATAVAIVVYFPLARSARLLARLGLGSIAEQVPLSFYRERSFGIMRNDSLDRLGTRLERRYTRDAMVALMRSAGLADVMVSPSPPLWHAIGRVHRD